MHTSGDMYLSAFWLEYVVPTLGHTLNAVLCLTLISCIKKKFGSSLQAQLSQEGRRRTLDITTKTTYTTPSRTLWDGGRAPLPPRMDNWEMMPQILRRQR